MPSQQKVDLVEELRERVRRSTVVISADSTGVPVGTVTLLRGSLRERGVELRVVKNTLAHLAADAAGRPLVKTIIEGPTALVLGYADPTEPARLLAAHVRSTRIPLRVKGGVVGERVLSPEEVFALATLPTKEELIARLLSQLLAPIAGLVRALNAPPAGLARVLQRHLDAAAR